MRATPSAALGDRMHHSRFTPAGWGASRVLRLVGAGVHEPRCEKGITAWSQPECQGLLHITTCPCLHLHGSENKQTGGRLRRCVGRARWRCCTARTAAAASIPSRCTPARLTAFATARATTTSCSGARLPFKDSRGWRAWHALKQGMPEKLLFKKTCFFHSQPCAPAHPPQCSGVPKHQLTVCATGRSGADDGICRVAQLRFLFERREHRERKRFALVRLYKSVPTDGVTSRLGFMQLSFDEAANEGFAPGACYEVVSLDTIMGPVLLQPDAIALPWRDDQPHVWFYNHHFS